MSESEDSVEVPPEQVAAYERNIDTYRAHLTSARQGAFEAYDKLVVTLAGGALALSLAFMRDVVQNPLPGTTSVLARSWALLAASLGFTLASLLCSQGGFGRALKHLDDEGTEEDSDQGPPGGWWDRATIGLNILAAVTLVAGVSSLVYFAYLNVGR